MLPLVSTNVSSKLHGVTWQNRQRKWDLAWLKYDTLNRHVKNKSVWPKKPDKEKIVCSDQFRYLSQELSWSWLRVTSIQPVDRTLSARQLHLGLNTLGHMTCHYMIGLNMLRHTGCHWRLCHTRHSDHCYKSKGFLQWLRMIGSNKHKRKCTLERKCPTRCSFRRKCWSRGFEHSLCNIPGTRLKW